MMLSWLINTVLNSMHHHFSYDQADIGVKFCYAGFKISFDFIGASYEEMPDLVYAQYALVYIGLGSGL